LRPIWLSAGLRRFTYVGVIPAQAGIQRAKRKQKATGFRRYDDQEASNYEYASADRTLMGIEQEKAARALLDWYRAMGVDEAIGDEPFDSFAASRLKPAPRPAPELKMAVSPPRVAPRAASATSTRRIGAEVSTLLELQELVARFEGCSLRRTAKSLCFARGSEQARIMMIGEAPGRDEDLQGKPFVGPSGKLLDRMLASIGLTEEHVYITNTVYWRPPGNRKPTPEEVEACAPFLARQIELLSPKVLVLLGDAAAKAILGTREGITRLRGRWRVYSCAGLDLAVLPTFHPSYLLHDPAQKRLAWRDLLMLKAALAAETTSQKPETGI
jgi:uracil-DNA glycosylase family 4